MPRKPKSEDDKTPKRPSPKALAGMRASATMRLKDKQDKLDKLSPPSDTEAYSKISSKYGDLYFRAVYGKKYEPELFKEAEALLDKLLEIRGGSSSAPKVDAPMPAGKPMSEETKKMLKEKRKSKKETGAKAEAPKPAEAPKAEAPKAEKKKLSDLKKELRSLRKVHCPPVSKMKKAQIAHEVGRLNGFGIKPEATTTETPAPAGEKKKIEMNETIPERVFGTPAPSFREGLAKLEALDKKDEAEEKLAQRNFEMKHYSPSSKEEKLIVLKTPEGEMTVEEIGDRIQDLKKELDKLRKAKILIGWTPGKERFSKAKMSEIDKDRLKNFEEQEETKEAIEVYQGYLLYKNPKVTLSERNTSDAIKTAMKYRKAKKQETKKKD